MNETRSLAHRLGRIPVGEEATMELEQAIREQSREVINGPTQHDQIRADAINAVLRAKGVEASLLLTAYEAQKVFTILSHLEELSGYQ